MAVWRKAIENTIALLGTGRRYLLVGAQVNLACEVDRRAIKIGPLSPAAAVAPCPALSLAAAQSHTAGINDMLRAVQRALPTRLLCCCRKITYAAVAGVLQFPTAYCSIRTTRT